MSHSLKLKQLDQSPVLLFIKDCQAGFLTCIHNTLALIGLGVIALAVSIWVKPTLIETAVHTGLDFVAQEFDRLASIDRNDLLAQADKPHSLSTSVSNSIHMVADFFNKNNREDTPPKDDVIADTDNKYISQLNTKQQALVSSYIARKYHLAQEATDMLVSEAYQVGIEKNIDPLLILGVMAIESGFNPFAESGVGAQGIMQVMSKVHQDKYETFGGVKAALDPLANLRVGVQVLKDCINRNGSLDAGLRCYVGATTEGDGGYGSKVLAEYSRLQDVSRGKKVAITTAPPLVKPSGNTPETTTPGSSVDSPTMNKPAESNSEAHINTTPTEQPGNRTKEAA